MKPFLLLVNTFSMYVAGAQIPAAARMTDWTKAGTHAPLPFYYQVAFTGDPTGVTDNSSTLQNILDTLTRPTIVLFGQGTFLFKSRIILKANTVLKGLGNAKTYLKFDQGAVDQPSIQIRGSEAGAFYPLTLAAAKNDTTIQVSNSNGNNFKAGDYFRLMQNDIDLVNDDWAEKRTGQMIKVDSVKNGKIYFSSLLRMDYPLSRSPSIRKVTMLRFSGVECLKISREDYTNTGNGSSNFDIRYVSDFRLSGVESNKCNYAHAEVYYSTNITMEDNYFYDAHNFGGDGRGYGIMLHYSTGEVLVQNNVFRRLRHAMILQAGANGNVFAYNYSYEGRKEIFPGFYTVGEDMVFHGNYPYLNLFEGNYAQFGSVDASHGKNGPYNTFFRNIATIAGFGVSNAESPSQNFTANHSLGGSSSFAGADQHLTDNSWQGASSLNHPSLAYSTLPGFLNGYNSVSIGPPAFNVLASIPARDRALANNPIGKNCEIMIWDGNQWVGSLRPTLLTGAFSLMVMPGANAIITEHTAVKSIDLQNGGRIDVNPGIQLKINQ